MKKLLQNLYIFKNCVDTKYFIELGPDGFMSFYM